MGTSIQLIASSVILRVIIMIRLRVSFGILFVLVAVTEAASIKYRDSYDDNSYDKSTDSYKDDYKKDSYKKDDYYKEDSYKDDYKKDSYKKDSYGDHKY